MAIFTGIIISLTLLSAMFARAYADDHNEAAQRVSDFCSAICAWSVLIACLLAGHWAAVVFGKF